MKTHLQIGLWCGPEESRVQTDGCTKGREGTFTSKSLPSTSSSSTFPPFPHPALPPPPPHSDPTSSSFLRMKKYIFSQKK